MRYHSEEQDRLYKIYEPYFKYDDRGYSYLPDDTPQEAKDAYEKVQKMIFEREKEESGWFEVY